MQHALVVENITDALRECVTALGGPKSVGPKMRPELPADQAAQYVRDRINPARRERFDPDQVMWLLREARKVGFHAGMEYVNQEGGYGPPIPTEPEDERARLQREYIEAVKEMRRLTDRIDRFQ